MQNKINQKVPIAKMDELITAIKESGGGGKLYRHHIRLVSPNNSVPNLTIYTDIITKSNIAFTITTLRDYIVNTTSVCVSGKTYDTNTPQNLVNCIYIGADSLNRSMLSIGYMEASGAYNNNKNFDISDTSTITFNDTVTEL